MPDLTIKRISYRELKEKPIEVKDDRYGIVSYFTDSVRQTFLACPGYQNDEDTAVLLLFDGDIAIGREIRYGTRLKIGDEIVWIHTGCSLMVCEEYRKTGAGILLLTAYNNDLVNFGALYTAMRVNMLKKQKRIVFEIPQYTKIVRTKPVFEVWFGLRGGVLSMASWCGDLLLKMFEIPSYIKTKKLLKKYIVKKETIIPKWAGELATNDGHKYMEYHDSKWLQWNLDYNMNGFPEDKQSFYSVWDKDSHPIGFFMTKERLEEKAGKYRNIVRGSIVEWATADKEKLTETDLNLLAFSNFSQIVSHITTVTVDPQTQGEFKKMGFIQHDYFHMSFKDKTGKYIDGSDMSNWRIRFGCSNSIIF